MKETSSLISLPASRQKRGKRNEGGRSGEKKKLKSFFSWGYNGREGWGNQRKGRVQAVSVSFSKKGGYLHSWGEASSAALANCKWGNRDWQPQVVDWAGRPGERNTSSVV